jgi:hypothetical protein
MSALGQKPTFAPQYCMSALPPKATSIAFFRMSAMGTSLAGHRLKEAQRAVQVGAIEGMAENQKSESASSDTRH